LKQFVILAIVTQGDTLAITIALLPIVFPQMPVHFLAYITYDWDFHRAQHPDRPTPLVQRHITLGEFRVFFKQEALLLQMDRRRACQ